MDRDEARAKILDWRNSDEEKLRLLSMKTSYESLRSSWLVQGETQIILGEL